MATEILCPDWCAGDCDGVHATEFEGVEGTEPDEEVNVRLSQGRDDVPVIELGANDGLGGSALLAMSLDEARKLRDLLDGLLYQATGEDGA